MPAHSPSFTKHPALFGMTELSTMRVNNCTTLESEVLQNGGAFACGLRWRYTCRDGRFCRSRTPTCRRTAERRPRLAILQRRLPGGLCLLRMRLSDMKPRADSVHRRNATGRKIIGEQLRGLHLQRIAIRPAAGQPGTGRHGQHRNQHLPAPNRASPSSWRRSARPPPAAPAGPPTRSPQPGHAHTTPPSRPQPPRPPLRQPTTG